MVDGVELIEVTTPIPRGASGGPIVDPADHVVGVSVSSPDGGQDIGLAVPGTSIRSLLDMTGPGLEYAEFAASRWLTDTGAAVTLSPWILGRIEGLEMDPEEVLASLPTPDHDEQEVVFQIRFNMGLFMSMGGELIEPYAVGPANEDGLVVLPLDLTPGSYLAVAVCEIGCAHRDLFVITGDRDILGVDRDSDLTSMVGFEVDRDQRIGVLTEIEGCPECLQAVLVFRKP